MINSKRMPNAKLVFANGISNLSKYRRLLVKKNSEFMPESKIKSIFKIQIGFFVFLKNNCSAQKKLCMNI